MKVVSFHRTVHEITVEAVTVEVSDSFVPSEDFDMPEAWADSAYAVHGEIVATSDWAYAGEAAVAQLPKGGGA